MPLSRAISIGLAKARMVVSIENTPNRVVGKILVFFPLGWRLLPPSLYRFAMFHEGLGTPCSGATSIVTLGLRQASRNPPMYSGSVISPSLTTKMIGLGSRNGGRRPLSWAVCGRWTYYSTSPATEKIAEKRDRAVAALEVAALDILRLARLVVGQRIEHRRPFVVFFRQPDLISPQRRFAERLSQEIRVVRRENDLGIFRVRGRVVELANDFPRKRRMQAAFQFIDQKDAAIVQNLQAWAMRYETKSASLGIRPSGATTHYPICSCVSDR